MAEQGQGNRWIAKETGEHLWPALPQDNFGYELPAVEAAMKKHEAIEADIAAYEERVQGVAELAQALAAEGYYDARRVAAQRDSVLRQWALLTGLVGARRTRLEQNLALQKIFQEMVYMVDWMEEMQVGPALGVKGGHGVRGGQGGLQTPNGLSGSRRGTERETGRGERDKEKETERERDRKRKRTRDKEKETERRRERQKKEDQGRDRGGAPE